MMADMYHGIDLLRISMGFALQVKFFLSKQTPTNSTRFFNITYQVKLDTANLLSDIRLNFITSNCHTEYKNAQ